MRAVCCHLVPAILMVAVIAHTHGIYRAISVLTVGDLTFFTTSFPRQYPTRFRTSPRIWTFLNIIGAETTSRASLCHLSSFDSALFGAKFWIRTKLNAWWTYASGGTRLTSGSSQLSTVFMACGRIWANKALGAYTPLRAMFYRSSALLFAVAWCDYIRLSQIELFNLLLLILVWCLTLSLDLIWKVLSFFNIRGSMRRLICWSKFNRSFWHSYIYVYGVLRLWASYLECNFIALRGNNRLRFLILDLCLFLFAWIKRIVLVATRKSCLRILLSINCSCSHHRILLL